VSLILPPRAASRTRELPDCCRIKFGGARQPVTRRTHSNLAVWISATLNYKMAKLTDEQLPLDWDDQWRHLGFARKQVGPGAR
jgi:hypothetical protein